MGVRYQLRKLLELMGEEDEDMDIEIYPGVNPCVYRVEPIGFNDEPPDNILRRLIAQS